MITGIIRQATERDSERILEIYSPYIENTTITFEIDVPTIAEFTQRVKNISSYYPYLVYVTDEKIVGYAYASLYRDRPAFRFDVEVSIYLDTSCTGNGVGSKLYDKLFELLKMQGFYNAYSGITMPNNGSEALHKKFGFSEIGIYTCAGFKHGGWHDVKWLQKQIRPYDTNPKEVVPIYNLPSNAVSG